MLTVDGEVRPGRLASDFVINRATDDSPSETDVNGSVSPFWVIRSEADEKGRSVGEGIFSLVDGTDADSLRGRFEPAALSSAGNEVSSVAARPGTTTRIELRKSRSF